ncbi:MAG: Tm-1-like ATP-binding domain-containing protein, partial [Planctomycetaceae bacterium]|nr:Tm-1-like ATP-binding domain-containing protein [Planctomycetaceae bacterium]
MPVYLLATCDTKGVEADFIRSLLRDYGVDVQLVDVGSGGHPQVQPDVPRTKLLEAAKNQGLPTDRGEAVRLMASSVADWVAAEHTGGRVRGVIAIGGSAGTTIGTTAMRRLPVGVPKLMVSTLASGNVRTWVQDKDILMLNSVVDIAGINRISRAVLGEAARAMAGMVTFVLPAAPVNDRPLIAATMFGVTTPCVQEARRILEESGYEVLIFHATGNGGQAMESLIEEGLIAGVLDITTTELA